jgi:hemolysin III
LLLCVGGDLRIVLISIMGGLTATLMITHLLWMTAPEALVGSTFVALGCLGGVALPFVWIHVGVAAFTLILIGGLLYIAGAIQFRRRWPDPRPAVFGFHEVFHIFVTVAAVVQYVAIGGLVI